MRYPAHLNTLRVKMSRDFQSLRDFGNLQASFLMELNFEFFLCLVRENPYFGNPTTER